MLHRCAVQPLSYFLTIVISNQRLLFLAKPSAYFSLPYLSGLHQFRVPKAGPH